MTRYVIVGNGVAGTTAAEEIRKNDPQGSITMFTDEDLPFYYRIRLPEAVAGEVGEDRLLAKKRTWYEEQSIDLRLQSPITAADPEAKVVYTAGGDTAGYDRLLLATGSHSFLPPIEGAKTPGVFTLRNIHDVRRLRDWAPNTRQAVLIGGGLLGLEAGNGLRKLGIKVTVVEFFPYLLPRQLDPEGATRLQAMLEAMGFSFKLQAKTTAISGEKHVQKVHLEDGDLLPADMVLVSAGVRPNLDLAQRLGLPTDKGVVVDDSLQTKVPGIYAAGDVAEWQGRMYGIWPASLEQGRVAGRNMAGRSETYQGTVMANTLKVVGIDLASAGEIDADAQYESRVEATDSSYRKLVLDNNRLIGCIMLGNTQGFQTALKLIKSGQDVSDQVDSLLPAG